MYDNNIMNSEALHVREFRYASSRLRIMQDNFRKEAWFYAMLFMVHLVRGKQNSHGFFKISIMLSTVIREPK